MFNFPEDVETRKAYELRKAEVAEDPGVRKAHESRDALRKAEHIKMLASLGLLRVVIASEEMKRAAASASQRVAKAKAAAITKRAAPPMQRTKADMPSGVGDLLLAAIQPRRPLMIDQTEDFVARQMVEKREAEHESMRAALATPHCSGR